jgi:hypothetical protein
MSNALVSAAYFLLCTSNMCRLRALQATGPHSHPHCRTSPQIQVNFPYRSHEMMPPCPRTPPLSLSSPKDHTHTNPMFEHMFVCNSHHCIPKSTHNSPMGQSSGSHSVRCWGLSLVYQMAEGSGNSLDTTLDSMVLHSASHLVMRSV